MRLYFALLILGALAFSAYQWAWRFISQFVLIRRLPGEGLEQILGWDILIYTWPFMVFGGLVALIVLPLLLRTTRAADRADLVRARDRAENLAKQANEDASNAHTNARYQIQSAYAERLEQLTADEAYLAKDTARLGHERAAMDETVEDLTDRLEQAVDEAKAATQAKNNAMAAATRQRKKLQKLEARIEQLTAGGKPEDHC